MATTSLIDGLTCPVPLTSTERVQLGHGSGGKMSASLFRERILPHFDNPALAVLGDAAVFRVPATELAISTDSFVVSPLEFPGGNIGSLAVHGTLNDLAMMGARPFCLTAGFVLEEGCRSTGWIGSSRQWLQRLAGRMFRSWPETQRSSSGRRWPLHQYDWCRGSPRREAESRGARVGDAILVSGRSVAMAWRSWRPGRASGSRPESRAIAPRCGRWWRRSFTGSGQRFTSCVTPPAAVLQVR